jgi:hypothetical protein
MGTDRARRRSTPPLSAAIQPQKKVNILLSCFRAISREVR